jgi:DNA (cytosine-5)-methyltransferase 1
VADAGSQRRQQNTRGSSCNEEEDGREGRNERQQGPDHIPSSDGEDSSCTMDDTETPIRGCLSEEHARGWSPKTGGPSGSSGLAEPSGQRGREGPEDTSGGGSRGGPRERSESQCDGPGPTNGFWRDVEWIPCRDGKARPTEPGTFPLAHGAPERVVRLRGYGDGIVSGVAEVFVRAYLDSH